MNAECPVVGYDRAGEGYAESVGEWLANPHNYFTAFGPEARRFQRRHRSERLRTMTLVAGAAELVGMRPVLVGLDGAEERVNSWESVFSVVTARLVAAHPVVFAALQRDGLLDWMGCGAGTESVTERLSANALSPVFANLTDVVLRVQWLFSMCGIRLNEVVLQVDPYTDEQWKARKAEIDRKRAADRAFLEGRRAAQRQWAETHPEDAPAPEGADGARHFL